MVVAFASERHALINYLFELLRRPACPLSLPVAHFFQQPGPEFGTCYIVSYHNLGGGAACPSLGERSLLPRTGGRHCPCLGRCLQPLQQTHRPMNGTDIPKTSEIPRLSRPMHALLPVVPRSRANRKVHGLSTSGRQLATAEETKGGGKRGGPHPRIVEAWEHLNSPLGSLEKRRWLTSRQTGQQEPYYNPPARTPPPTPRPRKSFGESR